MEFAAPDKIVVERMLDAVCGANANRGSRVVDAAR